MRLVLLGRFAATCSQNPSPIRFSTRKVSALLAYLAMNRDQTASREELATLLWGSCSDQQARQSLRQALAFLRKDLGSADLFVADSDVVRLQASQWSVDALEFERLSKSSDRDDLARAAALFGGDFLAGLNIEEDGFAEWLRAERARAQLAAARLCETFAARPDLVADGEHAIVTAERLLALDPLREDWQRLALTLYARYRGKREALAQADAFTTLLRRELDVTLEPETFDLVERIRRGEIAAVATALVAEPASKEAAEAALPVAPAEPSSFAPPTARRSRWPMAAPRTLFTFDPRPRSRSRRPRRRRQNRLTPRRRSQRRLRPASFHGPYPKAGAPRAPHLRTRLRRASCPSSCFRSPTAGTRAIVRRFSRT
jgi:DNA-binding SARP family transcriptional activator